MISIFKLAQQFEEAMPETMRSNPYFGFSEKPISVDVEEPITRATKKNNLTVPLVKEMRDKMLLIHNYSKDAVMLLGSMSRMTIFDPVSGIDVYLDAIKDCLSFIKDTVGEAE